MEFDKLLKFFEFLHKATIVQRTVKLQGRDILENNAEHSFQLALLCWYLIDYFKLRLNKELIFQYCLAHDLVEIYAGDTDPHRHSQDFIASKEKREKHALEKIKKQFPEFNSLTEIIEQYEKKNDNESDFVYIVDKIAPSINTFLANDTYYKENNVSLKKELDWFKSKKNKIDINQSELNLIIQTWKDFLKAHKKEIFK